MQISIPFELAMRSVVIVRGSFFLGLVCMGILIILNSLTNGRYNELFFLMPLVALAVLTVLVVTFLTIKILIAITCERKSISWRNLSRADYMQLEILRKLELLIALCMLAVLMLIIGLISSLFIFNLLFLKK